MVDFLHMNLDHCSQPALARLSDEAYQLASTLTEARFSVAGAHITRLSTEKKPKSFSLSSEEMDNFCDAWMEYRGCVIQHAADQEKAREQALFKAKQLAASVQFDLDSLNIQVNQDNDGYWRVTIPALGYERNGRGAFELLEIVKDAFTTMQDRVRYAEDNKWNNEEWSAIIASYRRVFSIEPQEITEAKRLLKEAGLDNWTITAGGNDTWTFEGPFGSSGEILMPDEPPALLLEHIKAYLERKASDRLLEAMDREEPEAIQQARALLEQTLHPTDWAICAVYPGTTDDCWNFDNGLPGDQHFSILNKPAAEMYHLINAYLIDIPRSGPRS